MRSRTQEARATIHLYEQAKVVRHSDGRVAVRVGPPGPAGPEHRWLESGLDGRAQMWLHDYDMALVRAPIVEKYVEPEDREAAV